MSYKVEWENELDTPTSALQAAKEAMKDIANGESLCFTVTDYKTGQRYSVDLNEEDEDAVVEMSE